MRYEEGVLSRTVMWSASLVLVLVLGLSAIGEDVNDLTLPAGIAPVLDGIVSEGEWDDAIVLSLADDAVLSAKHADGFLYLGVKVQTGAQVVGNIYIARDDTIEILHASYALGPATYRLQSGGWTLEEPFVWSCRTLGFSSAALFEREMFLQANNWLATIVLLGEASHMEVQIAINGVPMRMLFRFDVHTDTQDVLTWPLDTVVGIEAGPLPQEAGFHPETWCDVSFEERGLQP